MILLARAGPGRAARPRYNPTGLATKDKREAKDEGLTTNSHAGFGASGGLAMIVIRPRCQALLLAPSRARRRKCCDILVSGCFNTF